MNYSFGAALAFLPHIVGSPQSVVGPLTSWSSIARHAKLMVLFGGANPKNTLVSKGGCASHSTGGWIAELARAGVEVVNISPIREDGPDAVRPEWIPIRPNTDTAMLLALTHTLVSEGLHDREFLDEILRRLRARAALSDGRERRPAEERRLGGADHRRAGRHDPRAGAAHGGDPHDGDGVVVAAARASRRAAVLGGGPARLGARPDRPAGRRLRFRLWLGRRHRRSAAVVRGAGDGRHQESDQRHDPGGAHLRLPAAIPASAYDFNGKRGNYPDIRLVYWAGGNPFHHHQDTNKLRRAWQKPETVVVHEPWWTATARHADIVLPATTSLERNDIGGARRDKFIIAMQQAVEPVGEARNDFDIFSASGEAARHRRGLHAGPRREGLAAPSLRADAATAPAPTPRRCRTSTRSGSTGYLEIPAAGEEYVMFGDFRADPDKHKLRTPSGKIELYSEKIAGFGYDDCPPHPTWIEPWEWLGGEDAKTYPLHLVSSQPRDRLHSQMDCGPVSAGGKVAGREAITINPADAKARGISDGDVVRVHNARGACLAGAIVSDTVSAGVVKLSCGAWYDPADGGEQALCRHGNAERADPRSGHLEARAGAELGHRAGRGRALDRAAPAGRRLRSAAGGSPSV